MDGNQKKTALRMIPYGLYVLTGESKDGHVAAATINWVTQASFQPPLITVGVKSDSSTHQIIKNAGAFALNILVQGQAPVAFTFFKSLERSGNTIGGEPFSAGKTGAPILACAGAFVECKLVGTLEKGDHSVFLGEVVEAGVSKDFPGRPDDHTLRLKDLGEKTFYGG